MLDRVAAPTEEAADGERSSTAKPAVNRAGIESKLAALERRVESSDITPSGYSDRVSAAVSSRETSPAERKAALLDPPDHHAETKGPDPAKGPTSDELVQTEPSSVAEPTRDEDNPSVAKGETELRDSQTGADDHSNVEGPDGPDEAQPIDGNPPPADSRSTVEPGDPPLQDPEPSVEPESEVLVEVAGDAQPLVNTGDATVIAAPEARLTPSTQQEFWNRHGGDYVPPDPSAELPDVSRPHTPVREWVAEVNPDRDAPNREYNCGECSRATELNWRGVPALAAALADTESVGETIERMEEWAGAEARHTDSGKIMADLTEVGPGSSALIAVYWKAGYGHWFNAVNEDGTILAVDGQGGTVESWPPTDEVTGYSDELIAEYWAIVQDGSGRPVEKEHE